MKPHRKEQLLRILFEGPPLEEGAKVAAFLNRVAMRLAEEDRGKKKKYLRRARVPKRRAYAGGGASAVYAGGAASATAPSATAQAGAGAETM